MEEKKDYRTILTEKLIEQLEAGTAPWQKPWDAAAGIRRLPYNPVTGKEYRGANSLYLSMHGREDPRWATYKQAAAEGWQVRKGEKGTLVEYWKMSDERPVLDEKTGKPVLDDEGKPKTIHVVLERPQVFRAVVFNAAQMDGVPELSKEPREYEWNPVQRAEQILEASGAKINHDQNDRAFYRPSTDQIHLPGREQFPSEAAYYSTALHELGHWTGHETRLNRDLTGGFGSQDYAKEELRAELSSYFMADKLGVPHDPGQHAAYVKSWIKVLKEDKNEIFRAAKDAEKITEYVLQLDRERTQDVAVDRAPLHELVAENDAIGRALRDIGQENEQPGGIASPARHRLDEATEKAFDGKLPVAWTGNVKVVGLYEEDIEGQTHVRTATVEKQPQFFGVYGELADGGSEWIADRADATAAQQLAYRLTAIHQQHLPMPERTPDVTLIVPPAPEKHLATERTALDVPFKEKEQAKQFGAKWDKKEKSWYVPAGTDLAPLAKWIPVEKDIASPTVPATSSEVAPTIAAPEIKAAVPKSLPAQDADKTWLAVPFKEKNAAKDAGAKWDKTEGAWYVPAGTDLAPLAKWIPVAKEIESPAIPATSSEVAPTIAAPEVKAIVPKSLPAQEADKTWLAVPFAEKNAAKEAGAKWDKTEGAWYVPAGADVEKVKQWIPKAEVAQAITHAPLVDPAVDFGNAIRAAGLELDGLPEMDGKIHRVSLTDGKRGNRDGAYVGYLDGRPAGSIHNWVTGEKTPWKLEGPELSSEQRAELAAAAVIKKQMRAAELSTQHADAADKAAKRWDRAADMPADGVTPYLERKQVQAMGLKRDGDNLLVPVRDIDGKLWAIQTIFPEKKELIPGTAPLDKVFTKEAKKEGNFHLIGEIKPGQPVITMEGYATGASVHQATGYAVAVAFDSGNLDAVVGALKGRYPTNPHFIGADDDRFPKPGQPEKNAGLTKATEAANRHEVGVIVPVFSTAGKLTDFNDLHVSEGLVAVKQQIEQGVSLSMEQSRQKAEQLAKDRLGPGAEIKKDPGENTRHSGTIIGVGGYHAAQATSTTAATIHQVKDLESVPVAGQKVTIQYKDGRGKVSEKLPEKKKELQR